jgi:hypothetical protein
MLLDIARQPYQRLFELFDKFRQADTRAHRRKNRDRLLERICAGATIPQRNSKWPEQILNPRPPGPWDKHPFVPRADVKQFLGSGPQLDAAREDFNGGRFPLHRCGLKRVVPSAWPGHSPTILVRPLLSGPSDSTARVYHRDRRLPLLEGIEHFILAAADLRPLKRAGDLQPQFPTELAGWSLAARPFAEANLMVCSRHESLGGTTVRLPGFAWPPPAMSRRKPKGSDVRRCHVRSPH